MRGYQSVSLGAGDGLSSRGIGARCLAKCSTRGNRVAESIDRLESLLTGDFQPGNQPTISVSGRVRGTPSSDRS
jgi:hypothetical protein